ncbi:MAG: NADH-quinone oxidoreductase subunit [Paenibacillaceae bacterium]|jgi:NADH-quinone oxidoreductase subunit J|nr:NADH-quinone oxidoreductase subunit [Paenibacillaceae bacterium]
MLDNALDGIKELFSTPANFMFFVFALTAIGGAIFAISFTKVIHIVVSLAVTFLSLAGLYVLLEAEFVAFVQVLIYAGAISILMIFGIMMTNHQAEDTQTKQTLHSWLLGIGIVSLFGILFYAIQNSSFPAPSGFEAGENNTEAIGRQLFSAHVIPFELMSVLLTVAFIGAIVLAKKEDD